MQHKQGAASIGHARFTRCRLSSNLTDPVSLSFESWPEHYRESEREGGGRGGRKERRVRPPKKKYMQYYFFARLARAVHDVTEPHPPPPPFPAPSLRSFFHRFFFECVRREACTGSVLRRKGLLSCRHKVSDAWRNGGGGGGGGGGRDAVS